MAFSSFLVHEATFIQEAKGSEVDDWGNPVKTTVEKTGVPCKWVREKNKLATLNSSSTVVDNYVYLGTDFSVKPGDKIKDIKYKDILILEGEYNIESLDLPQGFGAPHHQKVKLKGVVPSV